MVDKKKLNIQVGKITPGIMITNFINHSLGDKKEFEFGDNTVVVGKKVAKVMQYNPEYIYVRNFCTRNTLLFVQPLT